MHTRAHKPKRRRRAAHIGYSSRDRERHLFLLSLLLVLHHLLQLVVGRCVLHLQLLADELGAELATLGHLCLHLAESGLAHLYSLSLEEISADPPLGPSVSPPSLQTWRMCCLRHVMHHHLVSHVRNVLFTFWMNTRAEYRRAEACCDSLVPLFAL